MPPQQDWFSQNASPLAVVAGGGDWFAQNAPKSGAPPVSTDPSGRTPTGEPTPGDTRNGLQRVFDNLMTPDPRREEWQSPVRSGVDDFAQHVASAALPLIAHPIEAAKSLGHAFANAPDVPGGVGMAMAQPMIEKAVSDYQEHGPLRGTTDALGTGAGMWATGEIGVGVTRAAGDAGSALRTAAIGNPDVAALKGLRVGPASPKALSTLKSVEGARPYLQGVQSLEDTQARVPLAKSEIWGPYQQTVDSISGKQVQGPDGPTTVGQLEQERQQISANLRALKGGGPEAIQLATQKGMNQADLLAREKAVQSALDPHLEQAGIDPKLIRQTFGQVAQVGGRVAGKSTLAEPDQPYGFGRMLNMRIDNPRSWIGEPAQGVRDLVAGRPAWSGKPTDINLREAFRTGGPKPDFRGPSSAIPRWEEPPRQLEATVPGNADYGADYTQGGFPARAPITPSAPPVFARLPANAGPGEAQPMVRYARPYVEPPESSTIRPMPPIKQAALPAQASPGETQPYIAHEVVSRGPAGESTRVSPTKFSAPEQIGATRTRPINAKGEVLPPLPRALLPEKTFPDNTPPPATEAPVFPSGSVHRGVQEAPYYPPASQFRGKLSKAFDFDQHIDSLVKELRKKEQ